MEDDNLLPFRLRSLRSRKRIIKKDLEKQIRKKHVRSEKLWHLKRNISLVPLDKPYQKGFVRFFAVREDIKAGADREFFETILEKINTRMYSENRKFTKKKKRRGRKIQVERIQHLERLSLTKWLDPKTGITDREKQYFMKKEEYDPYRKRYNTVYEFTEPWRFVLKVIPYMITHYKPLDSGLEKEYDALYAYLDRHEIAGLVIKKIYGGSRKWNDGKQETHLMTSKKYFTCKMSATEIAENLEDGNVRNYLNLHLWEI